MRQLQLPNTSANRRVTHTCPTHDQLAGASVTYQLELVQCGKPKCRRWHGPYWYAYWSAGGRTRSMYIGKKLRPAADVVAAKLSRSIAAKSAAQIEADWNACVSSEEQKEQLL